MTLMKELIQPTSISDRFKQSINTKGPVVVTREDAHLIKTFLESKDCEFQLDQVEKESLINGKQMRLKPGKDGRLLVYDSSKSKSERWVKYDGSLPQRYNVSADGSFVDRSMGLLAVLGTEKVTKIVNWCQSESEAKGAPGLRDRERTQGRGLQQTAADLVSLAILDSDEGRAANQIIHKINRRLWKGSYRQAKTDEDRVVLNRNFGYNDGEKPPKTLSSIHPELLPELVEYLTGLSA